MFLLPSSVKGAANPSWSPIELIIDSITILVGVPASSFDYKEKMSSVKFQQIPNVFLFGKFQRNLDLILLFFSDVPVLATRIPYYWGRIW